MRPPKCPLCHLILDHPVRGVFYCFSNCPKCQASLKFDANNHRIWKTCQITLFLSQWMIDVDCKRKEITLKPSSYEQQLITRAQYIKYKNRKQLKSLINQVSLFQ